MRLERKASCSIVGCALVALAFPIASNAATMRIAPSSASASAGSSVSISVQVSSSDQAMNAASGVINFPPDLLQVTSVSKSGSVIGLWVQEPSFSNVAGSVNFEGVVLNPGYSGVNGTVLTVNFRALRVGAASLSISSGSVLANDGNGTEILSGSLPGNVNIGESSALVFAPVAESEEGERLVVTSPTHPDQTKAYRAETARLEWTLPQDARAVRILYDKKPRTLPTVVYDDPPISIKEIAPGEGTWYFHAQVRTKEGWGPAAHFKLTIDPNALEVVPAATSTAPAALFDVSVEPVAIPSYTEDLFSLAWKMANYMTLFLIIAGIVGALIFLLWYLWHHFHRTRRNLLKRLAATDRELHAELRELQHSLKTEVERLKVVAGERELSAEENHILKLLDNTQKVMAHEFPRES